MSWEHKLTDRLLLSSVNNACVHLPAWCFMWAMLMWSKLKEADSLGILHEHRTLQKDLLPPAPDPSQDSWTYHGSWDTRCCWALNIESGPLTSQHYTTGNSLLFLHDCWQASPTLMNSKILLPAFQTPVPCSICPGSKSTSLNVVH